MCSAGREKRVAEEQVYSVVVGNPGFLNEQDGWHYHCSWRRKIDPDGRCWTT